MLATLKDWQTVRMFKLPLRALYCSCSSCVIEAYSRRAVSCSLLGPCFMCSICVTRFLSLLLSHPKTVEMMLSLLVLHHGHSNTIAGHILTFVQDSVLHPLPYSSLANS